MYDASELEIRFRTMFETMALGVVFQDANGKIVLANPAAEKILASSFRRVIIHDLSQPSMGLHQKKTVANFPAKSIRQLLPCNPVWPQLDKNYGHLQ